MQPPDRLTLQAAFASAVAPLGAPDRATVQVGIADVRDWSAWSAQALAMLDRSELDRACRQRLPHERELRVLAYALHRLFLAHGLGCAASEVRLYRDGNGCPRIEGEPLWTSLSHAGDRFAFAMSATGPVGIDLEPSSRGASMESIAAEVCHPDERRRLAASPGSQRPSVLLDMWVRKEAVLKALGVGLEVPMASFVAMDAATVRVPGLDGDWQVTPLDAGPDTVAAVASTANARTEGMRLRPPGDAVFRVPFSSVVAS